MRTSVTTAERNARRRLAVALLGIRVTLTDIAERPVQFERRQLVDR